MELGPSPVATDGVWLTRGGRTVLADVTVGFDAGAVSAVVGPSGAGKSSLLRCLNRLEEPERGRVLLNGIDIRMLPATEVRKRVAMIFQTPVIFPGGVRANLCYGLDRAGEDGMVEALEAAGLAASFLDRESSALSVGQAQRVCIARALMRAPEAVLMDEPTSALDRDAARRIEELAGDLAARGLTVVVVTHDLAQARRIAARAVLLDGGRVAADGTPEAIEEAWPKGDAR